MEGVRVHGSVDESMESYSLPSLCIRVLPRSLNSGISSTWINIDAFSPIDSQNGIVVEKTGGPEVLEYKTDLPVPIPGEGQILVKNHLASINYIDTYYGTGLYSSPKPEILGQEGIGTIVSLGPGKTPYNFAVGDRVLWLHRGSYCEYSAVPAEKAVRVPDGVSEEDALAAFLSALTSLTLVKEAYPVQRGGWVLIHAAAGGAGFLMTQILKNIGAKVIGTAGGPEKVNLVKGLGADFVIDYFIEPRTVRLRYGVVANIAVSHTAAGGSIPPIGDRRIRAPNHLSIKGVLNPGHYKSWYPAEHECLNEKERRYQSVEKKVIKLNSDRGNRTPGCRVRDGDVSHYTISDIVEGMYPLKINMKLLQ
ncbi:hypothetical protein VN97_g2695 [Penicillium thymicola]|uniref:Enoyl reductase (ER) domain-containing protein n=1 Tax=Penicillium thymicola TaxID=293382 RepID=A0AAI9XBI3_PENTH|nr:hypothetical protein VN97_g2695 [Penicillium thymicola]